MQFSYVNPTQIHFGQGQISAVSSAIPSTSKVLVIYGGGSIKKNGIYDQVSKALRVTNGKSSLALNLTQQQRRWIKQSPSLKSKVSTISLL